MKLSQLTDLALIKRTKEVAIEEKNKTKELLIHIAELDRRGLWGQMGFSSLFNFLVKGLKFSEAEASYRVSAIKLINSSAMAAEKISQGELGLTQAAKIQNFINNTPEGKSMTSPEREKLIIEASNKPTRQVETMIEEKKAPSPKPLKISLTPELLAKLKKLKAIYGEDLSLESLIEILLDEKIKENEFAKTKEQTNKQIKVVKNHEVKTTSSRTFSMATKKRIYQRAGGVCEFVSPISSTRCSERKRLQFDHIHPFALGGRSEFSNGRLLCRGHNLSESIKYFGDYRTFCEAKGV